MKRWRVREAGRWSAIFIACGLLFSAVSHAQEELPPEALGPEQYKAGAEFFITHQEQTVIEVEQLFQKLDDRHDEAVIKIAKKRLADYRNAVAMPNKKPMDRLRRSRALSEFGDIDPSKMEPAPSDEYLRELGEQLFYQRVIKGERIEELMVEIPGVGKAEPTSIDKRVYTRVVHYATGAAYLLVDNELDLESKHLKQYVARVNTQANNGKGRPLVLMVFNGGEIDPNSAPGTVRFRYYAKPKTRRERFKAWWRANYVAPDRGAVMLTAMSVLFSAGFTEGVEGLRYAMIDGHVWSHNSTMVGTAFGTVFGLWSSFYNNITTAHDTNDGNARFKATMKRMLISSATFAYTMQVVNGGFGSLTLMTSAGWLNHGRVWMNNIVNNMVKDVFKRFNDVRSDIGLSRGNVRVLSVDIKRNQFERQAWYQVPNFLKLGDQLRLEIGSFPIGPLLFYSSYFWGNVLLKNYAKKLNYPKMEELEASVNKALRLPITLFQNVVKGINATVVSRGQIVPEQFNLFLRKMNFCGNSLKLQEADPAAELFDITPEEGSDWNVMNAPEMRDAG